MGAAILHLQETETLWTRCLEHVQDALGAFAYNSWISPLSCEGIVGGVVTLTVPNDMVRSWVEKHYCGLLLESFRKVDETVETVNLKVASGILAPVPELESALLSLPRQAAAKVQLKSTRTTAARRKQSTLVPEGCYAHYKFENFVVGECNQLAFTVSQTVARQPGDNTINPLVLYGGTGLGKTHLLQSIGRDALEKGTAQKVLYKTAEQFLKDFMRLVVTGKDHKAFGAIYNSVDVLLIDDIQVLAHKASTQDELFKVLNRLLQQKKQIVFCCDQLPSQVAGLSKRLLERFAGGIACSLEAPDLPTRISILERKAKDLKLPPEQTDEILRWLASHHGSNVRELEGVVIKLLAFHELLGYELDLETVRQMLGDVVRQEPGALSIRDVAEATALVFGVKPDVLASRSRVKSVALPRKIALYLCRELTENSLQTIGLYFHRDYSTVIASLKTVEDLVASDLVLQARVGEIRRMLSRA